MDKKEKKLYQMFIEANESYIFRQMADGIKSHFKVMDWEWYKEKMQSYDGNTEVLNTISGR